jgi:RNA polymerase-interacting CarD/CdnL/TRCF family regulator
MFLQPAETSDLQINLYVLKMTQSDMKIYINEQKAVAFKEEP